MAVIDSADNGLGRQTSCAEIAEMRQDSGVNDSPADGVSRAPVVYRSLLEALALDTAPIVAEVVADVAVPDADPAAVAVLVRPAVSGLLASLARGPELSERDRTRLRADGAAAALRGEPVSAPIDRYLSAGWAIWDAATRHPSAAAAELATLGAALLRAGDAAAAAIAEGHGETERRVASRTASARRAFADDLLDLAPGDRDGLTRLRDRAVPLGVNPTGRYTAIVAWLGRDLEDAGPEGDRIERALARPSRRPAAARAGVVASTVPSTGGPIVSARRGRIVLVMPDRLGSGTAIAALLADVADGRGWAAVRSDAVGLEGIAGEVAEALAALAIVERRGPAETLVDATAVALERAILADPVRLAIAVDRELGPLIRAPRASHQLLETLTAYLASGQNVRATSRALGVAPRTVTYRLERIGTLLGRRLDGPATQRLATALLARELLGGAER